jgi:hypothetical protein
LTRDEQRQWLARVKREYEAGGLTATGRIVLMELCNFGRCRFGIWPSHELLARRARCCVRTVQDALQAARKLGLLEWWHQRVRRAWRALRAVNRYELRLPEGAVLLGRHGPGRTTGKSCRGDIQQGKTKAPEGPSGTLTGLLVGTVRQLTAPDRQETPEESRDRQLRALGFVRLIR